MLAWSQRKTSVLVAATGYALLALLPAPLPFLVVCFAMAGLVLAYEDELSALVRARGRKGLLGIAAGLVLVTAASPSLLLIPEELFNAATARGAAGIAAFGAALLAALGLIIRAADKPWALQRSLANAHPVVLALSSLAALVVVHLLEMAGTYGGFLLPVANLVLLPAATLAAGVVIWLWTGRARWLGAGALVTLLAVPVIGAGPAAIRFQHELSAGEAERLRLAVEEYRQAEGKFPESEEALVPKFIDRVPRSWTGPFWSGRFFLPERREKEAVVRTRRFGLMSCAWTKAGWRCDD